MIEHLVCFTPVPSIEFTLSYVFVWVILKTGFLLSCSINKMQDTIKKSSITLKNSGLNYLAAICDVQLKSFVRYTMSVIVRALQKLLRIVEVDKRHIED